MSVGSWIALMFWRPTPASSYSTSLDADLTAIGVCVRWGVREKAGRSILTLVMIALILLAAAL